jgi:hypothetical protein
VPRLSITTLGGRQAVVDALIHLSSGASAALEVTTLTDPAAHEVEQLLAAEDFAWEIPGCAWGWSVHIPPGTRIKRIREDLPRLVRWCEARGVTDPNVRAYIRDLPGATEWSDWLEATARQRPWASGEHHIQGKGDGAAVR